jgi:CRISPR-associated endoribonuclease Cas6
MRLNLTFKTQIGSVLPINYTYALSSFVYKTLQQANAEYSEWLHNQAYKLGNKQFKLFTFSELKLPKYQRYEDRFILQGDTLSLTVSFYADEAMKNFVTGLFEQQTFFIQDKKSRTDFKVEFVEIQAEPIFKEKMRFRALSPICVTQHVEGRKHASYLSPTDDNYEALFFNNLSNKYQAAKPDAPAFNLDEMSFRLLSERPKSRLIVIKGFSKDATKVRGFFFDFELVAPAELLAFGYAAGFGEKNSSGFGCVEII